MSAKSYNKGLDKFNNLSTRSTQVGRKVPKRILSEISLIPML